MKNSACMYFLEEQINNPMIFNEIIFGEFKMGLIPFDTDILSLEMENCFKQCNVDGDYSSLDIIAEALLHFQGKYGVIPNVRIKGNCSRKVVQKMMSIRVEELEHEQVRIQQKQHVIHGMNPKYCTNQSVNQVSDGTFDEQKGQNADAQRLPSVPEKYSARSEVDLLVILDRDVDLVSPLVTPLTYEGLIDDALGIQNGKVRLDTIAFVGTNDHKDALSNNTAANNAISAKADSAGSGTSVGENVSIVLNNNDAIFAEIRNLSIERLGSYLQNKAILIRERYTSFRDNKDASITEIHDFVKKIPKLTMEYKSLNQHINIAEMLKQKTDSRAFLNQWQKERGMLEGESYLDEVEDIMASDVKHEKFLHVLRLLCLQSVTAGGIRAARYDSLRRSVAQAYGFQHLCTMNNLERAGFLKKKDSMLVVDINSNWAVVRKSLRLIDERAHDSIQESISYVTAGYAPLSVRLVQLLGYNGASWGCIGEVLKLLPGPVLEFTQQAGTAEQLVEALERTLSESLGINGCSTSSTKQETSFAPNVLLSGVINSASAGTNFILGGNSSRGISRDDGIGAIKFEETTPQDKKTMMVFMVGGLSYLEIAALRMLSTDVHFPYRIVIATTKLINGERIICSVKHDF
mmetsp:Transcript_66264/g.130406  ORF Transcript_66264/g.130406 Transcript_66264/m.130406 type:complete len:633 (-) Transcript_66264:111-2009(-)